MLYRYCYSLNELLKHKDTRTMIHPDEVAFIKSKAQSNNHIDTINPPLDYIYRIHNDKLTNFELFCNPIAA